MAKDMADSQDRATNPPSGGRLDSWKEIAAYLKHSERTVRRWQDEGLPVYRHPHRKRAGVYAYKPEIDAWWNDGHVRLEEIERAQAGRRQVWPLWLAAGIVLTIFAVGIFFAKGRVWPRPKPAAGRIMLAVLPFDNLSSDPEQEYFSEGLTEEMISQLGRLQPQRLGVIARTSVMQFKGTKKDIREIGRELGVDYVMEGSVRRVGRRVRISAQLIDVTDQTHLLAESYERDLGDVLTLQSSVARAIADEIQVKLTPQQRSSLAASRPVNGDAYELYLRGRYLWNKRGEEDLKKAADHFQQAIDLDPNFALAYVGLADAYASLGISDSIPFKEAFPKAKAAALRALEKDGSLAEAHTTLAFLEFEGDWDFKGAEDEFKRAIDLNSGYATAHHWYGVLLSSLGRHDEAIAEMERARRLDPLSPIINVNVAWILYRARRYERAIQELQKVSDIDPNYIKMHYLRACIYAQMGMPSETAAAFRKFQEQASRGARSPLRLTGLGYASAVLGRKSEALRIVDEMERQHVLPYDIAFIFAALDEKDLAFRWLYQAYAEHHPRLVENVTTEPVLDPLRSDPRFPELLRRIGLPL